MGNFVVGSRDSTPSVASVWDLLVDVDRSPEIGRRSHRRTPTTDLRRADGTGRYAQNHSAIDSVLLGPVT